MSDEAVHGHTIPGRPDYRWSEPTVGQFVWAAIFLLSAYLAYRELLTVLAVVLVLVGIAGYAPYREGPGYVLAGRWLTSRRRRRNGDGVIYSTNLVDTSYEAENPKRVPPTPRDVQLVSVPIRDRAGTVHQLGLLHTPSNGFDTSVIGASGWPKAVMSDAAERMVYDAGFAAALKRAANRTKAPLTLVQLFIRRPADDSEAVRYLAQRLHASVRFEEGLLDPTAVQDPVDAQQSLEIGTAVNQTYGVGAKITVGIAVRAPRPKAWGKHELDKLPQDVVAQSPLFQTIEVLSNDLDRLGVKGVRRLSLFSLNALVRSVFDVYDLSGFYSHLAVDRDRERRGELKSLDDAMTLKRGPWPSKMYAANDHLETDRTFHRTFWIRNFDITHVPPGFFQELFNVQNVWYTIAHHIETIPGSREYRRATTKRRLLRRRQELFQRTQESDPKYDELSTQAEAEHYAIHRSASRGTRTRLMITVSSSSVAQLTLDIEQIDAICRGKGMAMQPYYGEAIQDDAMLETIGVTRKQR